MTTAYNHGRQAYERRRYLIGSVNNPYPVAVAWLEDRQAWDRGYEDARAEAIAAKEREDEKRIEELNHA